MMSVLEIVCEDDTVIPDDGWRLMAEGRALRCSTDSPEPESQLSSEPAPGHIRAGAVTSDNGPGPVTMSTCQVR